MIDDDGVVDSGISRRSALKRIGAGAAIAWTAPVLMSAGAKAFGASNACATCARLNCQNDVTCGQNTNGSDCKCAPHNEGGCLCYNNGGFCFGPGGGNICNTDTDCANIFGPGYQCLVLDSTTGCTQCGGSTFCGLPCGTPPPARPGGGGGTGPVPV